MEKNGALIENTQQTDETFIWCDDKVIDFVNWYIDLCKLDFNYKLENRYVLDSFKNGDDSSKWHF